MNIQGKRRDILQLGNPCLRHVAHPITDFTSDQSRQLIADLKATLASTEGVGLAAPQIGESFQAVIIASRPTARYPKAPEMLPVCMLNPDMTVLDERQQKDWEGCLSIPGIRARVPRYLKIKVHYQDEQGEPHSIRLEGFVARVFQHEFDHLQGLVYLDRVETSLDIISESEFLKQIV